MKNTFSTACILAFLSACGPGDKEAVHDNSSPEAQSKTLSVLELERGSTILLGRGFNSVSSLELGDCIVRGDTETLGGNGQKVTFLMHKVDSLEALTETLGISASASFKSGIYKGSAKAAFASSESVTSHSSYLLVTVRVENQTDVLKTYKYTEDAKALLKRSRSEFIKSCGDEFVAAKTTGGEFTAIVEFKSRTAEEKQKIEAQIKASGGTFKVAGDFKQSLSKFSAHSENKITILKTGGVGALPNLDDLMKVALEFPNSISERNAWVYTVTTIPYSAVLDGQNENPPLPRPIELKQQQGFLEQLFKLKMTLIKLKNDALYILQNQNQFKDVNTASLNEAQKMISKSLDNVETAPKRCFDSPENIEFCTMPVIDVPSLDYPIRFSDVNAACAWKREEALKMGRITKKLFDVLVEENYVSININGREIELPCEDYGKSL